MIRYKCDVCGTRMESPSSLVGEVDTCPNCHLDVRIPLKLGGWLILLAIGLPWGLLTYVGSLGEISDMLFSFDTGYYEFGAGRAWLMFVFYGTAVFFFFHICATWLFFKKAALFPGTMIFLLLTNFLFAFVASAWALIVFGVELLPGLAAWILVSGAITAIWVPYFLKSKRVSLTFVRRTPLVWPFGFRPSGLLHWAKRRSRGVGSH